MTEAPVKPVKVKRNYVDNKRFFAEMRDYKQEVYAARAAGLPRPRPNNFIGTCIWQQANRMATRGNFSKYSYKDEMVSDAIENCINYVDRFDETHPKASPYSYFNMIIWRSFLKRIEREKKEQYVKYKNMENSYIFDGLTELDGVFHERHHVGFVDMGHERTNDFVRNYEEKLEARKKKKKKDAPVEGLDVLFGQEAAE